MTAMARNRSTAPKVSLRNIALAELGVQSIPKQRVPAGALIMCPDRKTKTLYFVADGRIRLYRLAPTGEQVFQGELGPGDCLKCPWVLCHHECHTFAEAIVDSVLEVLPTALLDRLMRESVKFNQMLVQDVANQMEDLNQRFYETSVMPMKVRLHAELLRISRRRKDGTLFISPPPTHQELANRIGSQREAVSKELVRLERDGVIERSRGAISVLKEGVLRNELADWRDDAGVAANAAHPLPHSATKPKTETV